MKLTAARFQQQLVQESIYRRLTALQSDLESFLRENDLSEFRCACEPTQLCGPCRWDQLVRPLREALEKSKVV